MEVFHLRDLLLKPVLHKLLEVSFTKNYRGTTVTYSRITVRYRGNEKQSYCIPQIYGGIGKLRLTPVIMVICETAKQNYYFSEFEKNIAAKWQPNRRKIAS